MDSMSKLQRTMSDRLSALPDEVICHILSFLPTKSAVMTTVLSKRWNNTWTAVPNLDFLDEAFHRDVEFSRFVSWVLEFCGSSNIQKFKLNCLSGSNFQRLLGDGGMFTVERRRERYLSFIGSWISTAVELFSGRNDFELPKSLLLCKTLEVLKIGPNFVINDLPKSGNIFLSLRCLAVSVFHPGNGSMENRLHHFLLLEDLAIDGFLEQNEALNVNISAPKLKTLKIYLEVANGDYHEHNFFIKAPNLENAALKQEKFTNFTLETPNSLIKAEVVRGRVPKGKTDHALPEGISNVKYLYLRDCTSQGRSLPTFNNMNHLKQRCNYGRLLTELLEEFHNLEYLDIESIPKS